MRTIICIFALLTIFCGISFGQKVDGSFPGFPFGNVKIGMQKKALEAVDGEIKFSNIGGTRSVGVLKRDGQAFLFYMENDSLKQISYGWTELGEEVQKSKTQQLAREFATRFGQSKKSERARAVGNTAITIATLQYNINTSDVAVLESWGQAISITITGAREMAETERRRSTGNQKLSPENHTNKNTQRPGVENFGKERLKKPKDPSSDLTYRPQVTKDYITEINKEVQ